MVISKTLSVDTDNNGSITADELKEAMRQQGLNPSNEDLKRMISDVDLNGNGMVEFDEFCVMMSNKTRRLDDGDGIDIAFQIFDTNKDGHISEQELKNCMNKLGIVCSEKEIREMMEAVDENRDGKISRSEFQKLFE
jgi:Ca2+-binding EF-hand superfamily protein